MRSSPVEESEPPQPPLGRLLLLLTDNHMAQAHAKQISYLRERQYGAALFGVMTLFLLVVAQLHVRGV